MAYSLSSLLQCPLSMSHPNPKPTISHTYIIPHSSRFRRTFTLFSCSHSKPVFSTDVITSSSDFGQKSRSPVKKSFSVATGELFLGLASRIIRRPVDVPNEDESASVAIFANDGDVRRGGGKYYEEKIGAVMEDEIEPEVVWEQRVKDVEAEKQRRVVTNPGFSFSAAGLLFPYHLGVAQFLIENGYLKDTTPLAGSSAGAIVCAVIASGATMEEALKATKILAENCRRQGTAFRLGAVLRDVLDKFLPDDVHYRCNGRVRAV